MTPETRAVAVSATVTDAEIWTNLRQYAEAARGAFSVNTERALRADVAMFSAWCGRHDRQAMPASAETVAAFIDAMAAIKTPATVRRYVSSIATVHRAAKVANPCEGQIVKLALKRMHHEKGRAQQQAAPLNEGLVRKLLEARGTRLRDMRNRAILVVAYVTLCRRSELVALQFCDLAVEPDGFGTILVRRSKTDQEGMGADVPIPADAMRYVTKWIEAARITQGALFRAVRYGGSVGGALDPGDVSRAFKEMARRAGVPADEAARISGHSTRVGSAQDMLRYKETLPAIMASGRWKSPEMVGRYVAKVGARESAANRIAGQRPPF
jgi:site-specific recombinase XerD